MFLENIMIASCTLCLAGNELDPSLAKKYGLKVNIQYTYTFTFLQIQSDLREEILQKQLRFYLLDCLSGSVHNATIESQG